MAFKVKDRKWTVDEEQCFVSIIHVVIYGLETSDGDRKTVEQVSKRRVGRLSVGGSHPITETHNDRETNGVGHCEDRH
jgi:hypothetical protein